jgi:hypothetical protein
MPDRDHFSPTGEQHARLHSTVDPDGLERFLAALPATVHHNILKLFLQLESGVTGPITTWGTVEAPDDLR